MFQYFYFEKVIIMAVRAKLGVSNKQTHAFQAVLKTKHNRMVVHPTLNDNDTKKELENTLFCSFHVL